MLGRWAGWRAAVALLVCAGAAGCGRFQAKPADRYVYVTSKQANLRDRVAAVSNRTGQVQNGDKLKVLEHGRHWVKVQTDKGLVGWIEEKMVATGDTAEQFDTLKTDEAKDVPVANAVVRDEVYMHLRPGREAERFYLLNEGDKLQLLRRSTLVKPVTQATVAKAQKAIPQAAGSDATKKGAAAEKKAQEMAAAAAPAMEDWWLARDAQGRTGWVFARMLDVDAPDALTRYAEGQRIVGAYVLTTVHDDEAPGDVKDIPEYLAVLSPYKAGLPYDFDQVRVFVWSLKHHRYEGGFRDKNIEGYLPVGLMKVKDPWGKGPQSQEALPGFAYKVLAADAPAVTPDPKTGAMVPAKTITKTYRLEGNLVRRIAAPGTTSSDLEAHPVAELKKEKKGRRR